MELEDILKKTCRCCVSGKPLSTSKSLNFVEMEIPAPWPFPVTENLESGEGPFVVALVHDDCIKDNQVVGEIKEVIEIKGNEIIYHSLPLNPQN